MAERCPALCPICQSHPVVQVGPELWNCTSQRCNSQFYIDDERLLNVRNRVDRAKMRALRGVASDAGDMMILWILIVACLLVRACHG